MMSDLKELQQFVSDPLWDEEVATTKPTLIAGPCSAESKSQLHETAQALSEKGIKIFRAGVWKPRTYPNQFEGVGEKGLTWLREVSEKYGMLVGTEVSMAEHAKLALEYGLNFVWIGARTTSNPFLVQEIADILGGHNLPILIKNPLSPSIDLWKGAAMRFVNAGVKKIALIHRGFNIGIPSHFRNAPLWEVITDLKQSMPGIPIYLDPSHIAGNRIYIKQLLQMAHLLHYDGIMVESHTKPEQALTDRKQQITPTELASTLKGMEESDESQLLLLRDELGWIDDRLIELLNLRRKLSKLIGSVKRQKGYIPFQEEQYLQKLDKITEKAKSYNMPQSLLKELYRIIHNDSVKIQSSEPTSTSTPHIQTEEHTITLEGLRFFGYHGLLEHEKRVGNIFEVTATLHFPATDVMQSGNLEKGINYAEVYQLIEQEMSTPTELLESLTNRILNRLGTQFPLLTAASLSITKLAPPIAGFDGKGISFSATAHYIH